jgi:hypothetical protein
MFYLHRHRVTGGWKRNKLFPNETRRKSRRNGIPAQTMVTSVNIGRWAEERGNTRLTTNNDHKIHTVLKNQNSRMREEENENKYD